MRIAPTLVIVTWLASAVFFILLTERGGQSWYVEEHVTADGTYSASTRLTLGSARLCVSQTRGGSASPHAVEERCVTTQEIGNSTCLASSNTATLEFAYDVGSWLYLVSGVLGVGLLYRIAYASERFAGVNSGAAAAANPAAEFPSVTVAAAAAAAATAPFDRRRRGISVWEDDAAAADDIRRETRFRRLSEHALLALYTFNALSVAALTTVAVVWNERCLAETLAELTAIADTAAAVVTKSFYGASLYVAALFAFANGAHVVYVVMRAACAVPISDARTLYVRRSSANPSRGTRHAVGNVAAGADTSSSALLYP